MKNFAILIDALNFIENSLCEPVAQEDIARASFCSLSGLQKLFRYVFGYSVKEYLSKRRLTRAAKDLLDGMGVTAAALKYQYNSPEVFSRAFSRLWGVSPARFRERWKFSGIFPRIVYQDMGGGNMPGKKVDISELYDVLKSMKDTYVLCFDMMGLTRVNAVSYEAGDKAILEALKRIDDEAGEEMLLFRIGGDEFVLATGLNGPDEARKLAERILRRNGQSVTVKGEDFPVSLRAAAVRLTGSNLRYSELLSGLQRAICETRDRDAEIYFLP